MMVITREVVLELLSKSSRLLKAIDDNQLEMLEDSLEETHAVVKSDDIKVHCDELRDLMKKLKRTI